MKEEKNEEKEGKKEVKSLFYQLLCWKIYRHLSLTIKWSKYYNIIFNFIEESLEWWWLYHKPSYQVTPLGNRYIIKLLMTRKFTYCENMDLLGKDSDKPIYTFYFSSTDTVMGIALLTVIVRSSFYGNFRLLPSASQWRNRNSKFLLWSCDLSPEMWHNPWQLKNSSINTHNIN